MNWGQGYRSQIIRQSYDLRYKNFLLECECCNVFQPSILYDSLSQNHGVHKTSCAKQTIIWTWHMFFCLLFFFFFCTNNRMAILVSLLVSVLCKWKCHSQANKRISRVSHRNNRGNCSFCNEFIGNNWHLSLVVWKEPIYHSRTT